MHEVSIVTQLMSTIIDIAKKNKLKTISLVKIKIGKMRQIIPASFEFAFDSLKKSTIIEKAELELSFENIEIKCDDCNSTEKLDHYHFVCSNCQSSNINVIKGKDIVLLSLEGEQNGN